MTRLAAAALLALTLTACAAPAGAPPDATAQGPLEGRQCFSARLVNGFTAVDRDTVHVRAGVNDVFELQLLGGCFDIDWATRIGVRARGGSDFVCDGFDADLIVPTTTGRPDTCPVRTVRKLTPEEVAASRGR